MKLFFKILFFVSVVMFAISPATIAGDTPTPISNAKFNGLCYIPQKKCNIDPGSDPCPPDQEVTVNALFKPGSVTGNIVRCMQRVVDQSGNVLIENFVSNFSRLVYYGIMFGVLIWAMRMMFGIGKSRGLISIMLIKLTLVMYICDPGNIPQLEKWRDGILDFPKRFSSNILDNVEYISCRVSKTDFSICIPPVSLGTHADDDIFDKYDNYILHFFGAIDEPKDTQDVKDQKEKFRNEGVYLGIATMIAGLFFTGDIGNAVTMIGIMFILAVIVSAMQAIFLFTTIAIAVNILMALAPLMVTFILFDPLKKMTMTWFYSLLSYSIQPIIFTTFMAFTLGILSGLTNLKVDLNEDGKIDPKTERLFSGVYDKVHIKMEGQGDSASSGKTKFTIIDCDKMKAAASMVAKSLTSPNMMGQMVAGGMGMGGEMDAAISGGGGMADLSGNIQTSVTQGCDLMVDQIRLDDPDPSVVNAHDNLERFSADKMQELQAAQLAVVMLLVIFVMFLKKVPQITEKLTKQGAVAPLTKVAGGVGDKLQATIVGEDGYGGIIGKTQGFVQRSMANK